jgi:hypothetical protein
MCARTSFVELKYSQFKINHLNNTPSTKAVGGGIYSGVFNKDIKVPVKVRRRSSLVPYLPKFTQMKIYLLKVENVQIIPKSYISRQIDTISR